MTEETTVVVFAPHVERLAWSSPLSTTYGMTGNVSYARAVEVAGTRKALTSASRYRLIGVS